MERIVSKYRNLTILGAVLFAQVVGLAMQIDRPTGDGGSARLIRVWAAAAITPLERALVGAQQGVSYGWHNYFWLRGVRTENEGLRLQIEQLRLQQARLREDAAQAHRLQLLLAFKEQFVSQTIAAQVIGTSGSDHSRLVYLDKGSSDGLRPDMAVVSPDGIVGKVLRVFPGSAQVLLINDEQGGVGALLEKSRLQGIVRGTPSGGLILHNIMNDEKVEPGELVLASGGDRVFPKGMPIGRVKNVRNGADVFFDIEVTPAANLNRLEEVLVITKLVDRTPEVEQAGPTRAADMLAERLPTVPPPPPTGPDGKPLPVNGAATGVGAANSTRNTPKPNTTAATMNPAARPASPPIAASLSPKPAVAAPKTNNSANAATPAAPIFRPRAAVTTSAEPSAAPNTAAKKPATTPSDQQQPPTAAPKKTNADQQQPPAPRKTTPPSDAEPPRGTR